jgi:hypothetical protein
MRITNPTILLLFAVLYVGTEAARYRGRGRGRLPSKSAGNSPSNKSPIKRPSSTSQGGSIGEPPKKKPNNQGKDDHAMSNQAPSQSQGFPGIEALPPGRPIGSTSGHGNLVGPSNAPPKWPYGPTGFGSGSTWGQATYASPGSPVAGPSHVPSHSPYRPTGFGFGSPSGQGGYVPPGSPVAGPSHSPQQTANLPHFPPGAPYGSPSWHTPYLPPGSPARPPKTSTPDSTSSGQSVQYLGNSFNGYNIPPSPPITPIAPIGSPNYNIHYPPSPPLHPLQQLGVPGWHGVPGHVPADSDSSVEMIGEFVPNHSNHQFGLQPGQNNTM